jgi:hypothetical protein
MGKPAEQGGTPVTPLERVQGLFDRDTRRLTESDLTNIATAVVDAIVNPVRDVEVLYYVSTVTKGLQLFDADTAARLNGIALVAKLAAGDFRPENIEEVAPGNMDPGQG